MLIKKLKVTREEQRVPLITGLSARRLAMAAAVAGVVGCGGGGGGGEPPPKPPALTGIADSRTIQDAGAETLLAFRLALVASPEFPAVLNYRITSPSAKAGTSCGNGADYYVLNAGGVSSVVSGNDLNGTINITSAQAARQVQVVACPGNATGDKVLTLTVQDSTTSKSATGTIRGAANTSLANAKVLNDTGITSCATDSQNGVACPSASHPGQDAVHGRDANASVVGAGGNITTAFALNKLPQNDCIQDNVTGLIWESKTGGQGVQGADATYTWYNTDTTLNGGASGTANAGTCSGVTGGCDTASYVAAANAAKVCGFSDWRLPTAHELSSIIDSGALSGATVQPAIANQKAGFYWTSQSKPGGSNGLAVVVDFSNGVIGSLNKNAPAHVRLVRGR